MVSTATNQAAGGDRPEQPSADQGNASRGTLFRLRDASWQPQMDGETALRVLFMSPERRARFEFNEPGTLESFAVRRLPTDPAYGFAVVIALARVFVDHRESPDVRIRAAEALIEREAATGKALVLALQKHPDEAQQKFAGELIEPLVGPHADCHLFGRVVPHIATLLFSSDTLQRSTALRALAQFTREKSQLIAASISALSVEGPDAEARGEGQLLLKTTFPETTSFLPRAA